MRFECVRDCGPFRKGHIYVFERPIPVSAMSAMRSGHLLAAGGWCAPSEAVYSQATIIGEMGLEAVAPLAVKRGGIRFEQGDSPEPEFTEPVKPKRKPRKKPAEPPTLESLAAETAAGLGGLRGQAPV